MITHNVIQGSSQWLALRSNKYTASEAPAMMGVSKYKSRSELLAEKKTGVTPEITPELQKLFDKGHAAEESARAVAEQIVGEDLFPVTGECEKTGLLASFDGITMMGSIIWEHKLINENLRTATVETLDEQYKVQMDQQLMVSGSEKCLFMASDGTSENMVHLWYTTTPERQKAIIDGWKQFDNDIQSFEIKPPEPEIVGTSMEALPALSVKVEGRVLASNLDSFRNHAMSVIESINTNLQTDQDFADAETAIKWCKDVEKRLNDAEGAIMAQTADIENAILTLRGVYEATRQQRLTLGKMVKQQKEYIRRQIVIDAKNDFSEYCDLLNEGLNNRVQIIWPEPDIQAAIKGKRTIDSLKDSALSSVASAKIKATELSEHISKSLNIIDTANRPELFRDLSTLVIKDHEALEHIVKGRVEEAEKKEQERIEAQANVQEPMKPRQQVKADDQQEGSAKLKIKINLGEINAVIAPLSITAKGLEEMGFKPVAIEKNAKLYDAGQFCEIKNAMIQLLHDVQLTKTEAA